LGTIWKETQKKCKWGATIVGSTLLLRMGKGEKMGGRGEKGNIRNLMPPRGGGGGQCYIISLFSCKKYGKNVWKKKRGVGRE